MLIQPYSQLPPLHGLLHILGPPLVAPPQRLQIRAQTASQMAHTDPLRIPCIPSPRRLPPVRTVPFLHFCIPHAPHTLPRPLRRSQLMGHFRAYILFSRERAPY